MTTTYTHIADLARQVELPEDGTLSRTLLANDNLKVVLFGFSAGQELSEHTASVPAIMHFLSGEARVKLGDDTIDARAETWIHMPAEMPHSIAAKTATTMLLLMLKG